MDRTILFVGIGGFIGSVLRYLVSLLFARLDIANFPLATLSVNILGCFLIGLVLGLTERGSFTAGEVRSFVVIGILGGFTTFSAFSYETIRLLQEGAFGPAAGNIFLNVALGLGATWLGLLLSK